MRKLNKWFVEVFLESFDAGEYHAQDGWLKPWQYKGLMNLAEVNRSTGFVTINIYEK